MPVVSSADACFNASRSARAASFSAVVCFRRPGPPCRPGLNADFGADRPLPVRVLLPLTSDFLVSVVCCLFLVAACCRYRQLISRETIDPLWEGKIWSNLGCRQHWYIGTNLTPAWSVRSILACP